jgi:thioredoxin 1
MTTTAKNVRAFDETSFDEIVLQSKEPVLVDFWAEWCPPCKAIGPVIDDLAAEYEGRAAVGKVDVDKNPALASRFSIASIPALLFFKDGKVVDQVQGAVPKSELTKRLDRWVNPESN